MNHNDKLSIICMLWISKSISKRLIDKNKPEYKARVYSVRHRFDQHHDNIRTACDKQREILTILMRLMDEMFDISVYCSTIIV